MNPMGFCSTNIEFINLQQLKVEICHLVKQQGIVVLLNKTGAIRWNLDTCMQQMSDEGNLIWINQCSPNPTQRDIVHCLHIIGNRNINRIVAIGGGSIIDLAKGLSAFYDRELNSTYVLEDITAGIQTRVYSERSHYIDIIAVPTTAGTGAELTQWGTIWDAEKHAKFSIDCPELKPKAAYICAELTLTLSKRLILSTGLDALTHAMEAFWSKRTTPLAQELALGSIQLYVSNLKQALTTPDNYEIRERLCRASVLSALAFSQTRTTACHSISYPMTFLFGIEHGLAVAMTLGRVYDINRDVTLGIDRLDQIFKAHGGVEPWLDLVCEDIVALKLSRFGLREKDIDIIAEKAFTAGRMENNPVELSMEDVKRILMSVF